MAQGKGISAGKVALGVVGGGVLLWLVNRGGDVVSAARVAEEILAQVVGIRNIRFTLDNKAPVCSFDLVLNVSNPTRRTATIDTITLNVTNSADRVGSQIYGSIRQNVGTRIPPRTVSQDITLPCRIRLANLAINNLITPLITTVVNRAGSKAADKAAKANVPPPAAPPTNVVNTPVLPTNPNFKPAPFMGIGRTRGNSFIKDFSSEVMKALPKQVWVVGSIRINDILIDVAQGPFATGLK